MQISERFKALRRGYDGLTAKDAVAWARDSEAREAFFAGLRHAYWTELGIDGWRDRVPDMNPDFSTDPDSRVALMLWSEPDHHQSQPDFESANYHYSAVDFFAGRSDFISHREARDFQRGNLSWNLRSEFESARKYFRGRYSRQEAEVKARAQVLEMARELSSPPDLFGYGYEVYYRDLSGRWIMRGSDSLWGCDHIDAKAATWEMGVAAVFREALELAGAHHCARSFALR